MNRAGNERTGNRMLNIPVKGGAELTEATMAAINSDGYAVEATASAGLLIAGCVQRYCDNRNGADGQVTSVEVQEAGSVYVAQDEKGRYKKSQPVGYENAKVMIDILLEDTKTATTLEQLTEMQRLFKPYGQDKPKLLPIVNEDCAVRGITKVYFKNLTSKKVISESKRIASLELWAPDIAGIKVKKKTTKKKTTKKSTKKSKSKKSKSKSPAKDSRNTSRGKKAARAAVK